MRTEQKDGDVRLTAVKDFYRLLTPAAIGALDTVYHHDVVFSDPACSIIGCRNLQRHFERLLKNIKHCRFEFFDDWQLVQGDAAVLFWRMTLATPALAYGREFSVDGVSRLQYCEALIIAHRDYFDLGALLYEQLPLLGGMVRRLRRRLAQPPRSR